MSLLSTFLYLFGMSFVAGGIAQNTTSHVPSATISVPFPITPAPYHPPIPPANTPALPAEFSDIPQSAVDCWDALANYSTAIKFLSRELKKSSSHDYISFNTTTYSSDVYTDIARYVCNTTYLPSLTTLCDGYPRASTVSSDCETQWTTWTATYTKTDTVIFHEPEWSTEIEQLQYPECTIASDFGQCTRLSEAYDWRVTHLQSKSPIPTGSILPPHCSVLNRPISTTKPACYLDGGSWQAFYWPSPLPTGSAFCNRNGTNSTTATPTIPGQANTAVVSGLTMTSPSVYYLIKNATLRTFAGQASFIGSASTGQDAYLPSTEVAVLTAAQRESEILTVSAGCVGSGKRRRCTYHAVPHFSIADLATVRADEYCSARTPVCPGGETIYQDEYGPTLGVPISAIVEQNGVFSDCEWTTPGSPRTETAGPPLYRAGVMWATDWIQIPVTATTTTKEAETTVTGV